MARFRKRKIFQILAGVLSVVLVISFAALSVVYITLPAVRSMVNDFVPIRPLPQRSPNPGYAHDLQASRGPASVEAVAAPRIQVPPMLEYLLSRFSSGVDNEIRTCQLLANPTATPKSSMEWRAALDRFATGDDRDDPLLESVLIPAGFFARLPAVRTVLTAMRDALNTGDPRFLDQPDFPSRLSAASLQVIRSQDVLSRLSGRAYHLVTLVRAVQMNPSLVNDTQTIALCNSIANAARADMRGVQDSGIQDERARILDFLAAAGLSPAQVGFDPNVSLHISAVATERQVSLSTPWLTRMMGIPFYVVALRAMLPATPTQ